MITRGGWAVEVIIGREGELDTVTAFLAARRAGAGALLLEGPPGMGKTTLWRAALAAADDAGFLVCSCTPSGSEVRLSYSGITDLLEPVLDRVARRLPEPQRRALEVATLRADAGDRLLDQRAVSAAVLGTLRLLTQERPVVVAVDDAQWLDAPSAEAIEYAVRRLGSEPVAVVATLRTGSGASLRLEPVAGTGATVRIQVAPLSLGAVHRLLRERLGLSLSRPRLRRLHEASGGNPFYALELARDVDQTEASAGAPPRLSATLAELLGGRIHALPEATRTALFVAAAVAQPTLELVGRAIDAAAGPVLGPAVSAGVIEIRDGRISFAHPLLAAAAYAVATAEPRVWHARLATLAADPEEQARHLALSIEGPDRRLASALVRAARRARARGAPAAAGELYRLAVERTPPGDIEGRASRTLESVPTMIMAGERRAARELLDRHVLDSAPDTLRVDGLLLRAELAQDDRDGGNRERELLLAVLGDPAADDAQQARALLALEMLVRHADRLADALELARQALTIAERLGDDEILAHALTRTADLEVLLGLGGEPTERFARALALDERVRIDPGMGPGAMLAACLIRAGRVEEARPLLDAQLGRAGDEGDEASRHVLSLFAAERAWLAGDWALAEAHARDGRELAEQSGSQVMWAALTVPLALVEGMRGDAALAIEAATRAAAVCEDIDEPSYARYNRGAAGFLEHSRGDQVAALHHLGDYSVELGVEGTKRISFITDSLEALIATGATDRAAALVEEVRRRGRLLRRAPLDAAAARGAVLLAAAAGAPADETELQESLAALDRLGLPFERARTLLVLGEARRRAKAKRSARDALEAALAGFEAVGAGPWIDRARDELARVGGRVASGELTATERRVAELVAAGLSNKEVAARLYVSVRAVEANLSRIYTKLGVTSRTELARRF